MENQTMPERWICPIIFRHYFKITFWISGDFSMPHKRLQTWEWVDVFVSIALEISHICDMTYNENKGWWCICLDGWTEIIYARPISGYQNWIQWNCQKAGKSCFLCCLMAGNWNGMRIFLKSGLFPAAASGRFAVIRTTIWWLECPTLSRIHRRHRYLKMKKGLKIIQSLEIWYGYKTWENHENAKKRGRTFAQNRSGARLYRNQQEIR